MHPTVYDNGFTAFVLRTSFSSENIMNENVRNAFFRQVGKEPFARKFAIRLVDIDDGYSKVEMKFTSDMENILGMAHGGAIFALIDEAFETASNSHGTIAVALNMNITYVSSPPSGSILTAEAREFSRTQKTAGYDIKVKDEKNNLIASCQALVYRKGNPLPFLKEE
jgi:acyl-CoA thioesterase